MIDSEHNLQLVLMGHCLEKHNSSVFIPNFHFGLHEADLVYVTKRGFATEYEIKISRADFRADAKKKCGIIPKSDYLKAGRGANYFYYVAPKGLIDISEIPDHAGLIEIDLNEIYLRVNYIKQAPRLHKIQHDWIKKQIFEKAYYRYLDKITLPAIRKSKKQLYEQKYKIKEPL